MAACLNKHGVSLHKYRSPSITFPTHELGTVSAIVNGAPSIRFAGVATQSVPFGGHIDFPRQQISNPFGFLNSTLGDVTLE
jgi:hypothetical protein